MNQSAHIFLWNYQNYPILSCYSQIMRVLVFLLDNPDLLPAKSRLFLQQKDVECATAPSIKWIEILLTPHNLFLNTIKNRSSWKCNTWTNRKTVCLSKEVIGTNNKHHELSIKLSAVLYVTETIMVPFFCAMKGLSHIFLSFYQSFTLKCFENLKIFLWYINPVISIIARFLSWLGSCLRLLTFSSSLGKVDWFCFGIRIKFFCVLKLSYFVTVIYV